ncbi:hypothetical protein KJ652_07315, partial [Patescibacteria group bacterium]|nr:hypothetical protein [Patescibacteria group bacterium]
ASRRSGYGRQAGRFGGRAAVGRANFCDRRPVGLQFRLPTVALAKVGSYFVQQRQPIGTFWSLAQNTPAFFRFPSHRFVLSYAAAYTAHTFFRFFPCTFI